MSASDESDDSFGWNDTGADTMSSSEEGDVSTASSLLDRKTHKNKLRKELHSAVKQNELEGSDGCEVEIYAKKKKKKKMKREPDSTFNNTMDDELPYAKSELEDRPKKNKIKIESDVVSPYKTPKSKRISNQQESEETDITDLKEEEENELSAKKKKKKKKRKENSTDQQSIDETKDQDNDTPVIKKRRKNNAVDGNDAVSELLSVQEDDRPIENFTERKKRISFCTNSAEIKLNGGKSDSTSSSVACKMSTSLVASNHNDFDPPAVISKPITSATDVNMRIDSRNSFPMTDKRTSFSERIHFEEELPTEDDSEKESTRLQTYSTPSKKTKHFMDRNPHLKKIKLDHVNKPITKDDEVWILKCPKDLNHISLENSKISLEDKTKLKVDGQTYEGHMQKDSSQIAVLFASSTSACEIRDIYLKGSLTLRKRIPKVPINENSIVITNETFIPLPETKPRHPLFGPDYRKMIKIPAAVAKHLADTSPNKLSSKRKHKVTSFRDEAVDVDVATDVVDGFIKKKKKKRKLSETANDDVPVKKERKKFKHDPEVWNSEKAIEQNLFDF